MEDFSIHLLSIQLRGLGLTAIALLVCWALRKRSIGLETFVWRGLFAGLFTLPLLYGVLPPVSVSLPQSSVELAVPVEAFQVTYPDAVEGDAVPLQGPVTVPAKTASAVESSVPSAVVVAHEPSSVEERVMVTAPRRFPVELLALGIWIAGAAAMLVRLLVAFAARAKLHRQSQVSESATVVAKRLAKKLGIKGQPSVRLHNNIRSPLGWGMFRPVILLPEEADQWNESTLDLVLRHELTHFSRKDALFRLIAECSLVVFWVNPLAWVALRRLRLCEELVTDAAVLSNQREASIGYAELLLRFARGQRGNGAAAQTLCVSMAQPSTVEQRIRAILEWNPKAMKLGRSSRLLCGALLGALILPTGGLAFQIGDAPEQVGDPPKPIQNEESTVVERSVPYRDLEVVFLEIPTEQSQHLQLEFGEANQGSGAWQFVMSLAEKDPAAVHLAGVSVVNPAINLGTIRSRVGVQGGDHLFHTSATIQSREESESFFLNTFAQGEDGQGIHFMDHVRPGETHFAGAFATPDATSEVAVFLTLRRGH